MISHMSNTQQIKAKAIRPIKFFVYKYGVCEIKDSTYFECKIVYESGKTTYGFYEVLKVQGHLKKYLNSRLDI